MIIIKLHRLGYLGDIDLKWVLSTINKKATGFVIEEGDGIFRIGKPDLTPYEYSFQRLYDLMPTMKNETIQIGVITSPIERNYFSKTNEHDKIVITTFQAEQYSTPAQRTVEEYIVHNILSAFLFVLFRRTEFGATNALFHEEKRGDLFDQCNNKLDLIDGLKAFMLDTVSKAQLLSANIPEKVISQTESILRNIRTPSFMDSLRIGLHRPLFSFWFGGVFVGLIINLVSSFLLGDFDTKTDVYVVILLIVILVLMIALNYVLLLIKRRKLIR